jgi:MoaA/NifB/PqqE/SkfB family radical SAM enzyme
MVPKLLHKIRDQWNVLSHFNAGRAWNAVRVLSSYYYSRLTQKPVQWGKPISVSIEPTTACNLGCPECPSGLRSFTRPTGNLNADVYQPMIDELSKHVTYLIFYFQGEPYINPKFLDMVEYAGSKGIYTATSTNAHFLDDERAKKTVESGLDRIIISIDGTTQETYENYRRKGTLSKVLEGTENLLKWKRKLQSRRPYVIFQFLVVRPNEHQIPEIKKLGREMGVDEVKFKTAQIYDYKNGNPLIPTIDK